MNGNRNARPNDQDTVEVVVFFAPCGVPNAKIGHTVYHADRPEVRGGQYWRARLGPKPPIGTRPLELLHQVTEAEAAIIFEPEGGAWQVNLDDLMVHWRNQERMSIGLTA